MRNEWFRLPPLVARRRLAGSRSAEHREPVHRRAIRVATGVWDLCVRQTILPLPGEGQGFPSGPLQVDGTRLRPIQNEILTHGPKSSSESKRPRFMLVCVTDKVPDEAFFHTEHGVFREIRTIRIEYVRNDSLS